MQEETLLPACKKRVALAMQLDKFVHADSKQQADHKWMVAAAADLGAVDVPRFVMPTRYGSFYSEGNTTSCSRHARLHDRSPRRRASPLPLHPAWGLMVIICNPKPHYSKTISHRGRCYWGVDAILEPTVLVLVRV